MSESGQLYDLNTCIVKDHPFGIFVDFRINSIFERKYRLIEVSGAIESHRLKMICSPKYFNSRSYLFQIMRAKQPLSIVGFGLVINVTPSEQLLEIKALVLASVSLAFRL